MIDWSGATKEGPNYGLLARDPQHLCRQTSIQSAAAAEHFQLDFLPCGRLSPQLAGADLLAFLLLRHRPRTAAHTYQSAQAF